MNFSWANLRTVDAEKGWPAGQVRDVLRARKAINEHDRRARRAYFHEARWLKQHDVG
jgi:hypothetical protein